MSKCKWKFCAGGLVEPLIHKEIWIDTFSKCLNPSRLPRNYLIIMREDKSAEFISASDLPQLFEVSKKFMNKRFLQDYLDNSANARKKFLEFSEEVQKTNLNMLSNDEIALLFQRYLDVFKKVALHFWATQGEFMQYPELILRKRIKQAVKIDSKAEEAVFLLIRPTDPTIVEKEQTDFIKLVEKAKVHTKKELENHAFNYPWLLCHEFDRERGIDFLKKRLKLYDISNADIFSNKKQIASKQRELLDRINDPEVDYLSSFFKKMALERFELKACWAGAAFLFSRLFQEIVNLLNVDTNLIWGLKSEDVLSSLRAGRLKVDSQKLSDNCNSNLIWLDNNKMRYYEGEKSLNMEKKLLGRDIFEKLSVDQLEGKVACAGKARGCVRVIRARDPQSLLKDFNEFKEDEIMVVTMIQPNMIPILRKAKAIITEEGGIASHAAVIAREFNIPCIVGTGNATHVLSNGDIVEVDAEKGIVRKLDQPK